MGKLFNVSGWALFLLAIIFNFIHLGAIFWYPGAILWSVVFLDPDIGFCFQRFRYQVIGYGPVNIAGTGFIFNRQLDGP